MQTFAPYKNCRESAKCLDKKRAWKQVVEAKQILATNGIKVPKRDGGYMKASYVNHPIHNIWKNHLEALMHYHDVFLEECIFNHGINTTSKFMYELGYYENKNQNEIEFPKLFGYKPFHDSHKSNLLRKNPEFYGKYNWNVSDDLEYIWKF